MDVWSLGWSADLADRHRTFFPELCAGRISAEHRDAYRLLTPQDDIPAQISGQLRHRALSRRDLPAVGDWVVFSRDDPNHATIRGIFARNTIVTRRAAGTAIEEQIIAANVDSLFLVSGLDGDFNLRRIERYVALAGNCGVRPVIVLNKSDVCADVDEKLSRLTAAGWDVPTHVLSAIRRDGVADLAPYLSKGQTIAIVGSSGVGKSTLANVLLGENRQGTGEVRVVDDRGRHTTSARCLLPLPSGAVLLDTPGMRELQLWAGDDGLSNVFADIETLAARCRFSDCAHATEPGCAIRAELGGNLDEDQLDSYRKLHRELAFHERKADLGAQAAEKARWKKIPREAEQHAKWKRRR